MIYHASLIGQAAAKNKGKISRVLAAKTALSVRVDALGETTEATIGLDSRMKVEQRMRQLESGGGAATPKKIATPSSSSGPAKYNASATKALAPVAYNPASDIVLDEAENSDNEDKREKKEKKKKHKRESEAEEPAADSEEKSKKKKKHKHEE